MIIMLIFCNKKITDRFSPATIDVRNLIFGHKLHIGTPYRRKRFWTHQIPTSCLPILLIFLAHLADRKFKMAAMTRLSLTLDPMGISHFHLFF